VGVVNYRGKATPRAVAKYDTVELLAQILADAPPLPDAACVSAPELFDFDAGPVAHELAIKICRSCPELVPCGESAARRRLTGIAGGVYWPVVPPRTKSA
jgi:hypothetical protein